MIRVECKLKIYQINNEESNLSYPDIIIESDCREDKDFVILQVFGVKYRVLANELINAVENAINIRR